MKAKCKICRTPFNKQSISHKTCSVPCAIELAQRDRTKKEKKELLARKEAIRSRADWMKLAQAAFNAFIRKRDRHQLCICCDKPLAQDALGGGFDCGHYRSVGSAPHLRFDPRNAHGQRKQCNRWGSGRAVDYRLGLIKRVGLAEVESLEADQTPRKHTIDDLKEIIRVYKQAAKDMETE